MKIGEKSGDEISDGTDDEKDGDDGPELAAESEVVKVGPEMKQYYTDEIGDGVDDGWENNKKFGAGGDFGGGGKEDKINGGKNRIKEVKEKHGAHEHVKIIFTLKGAEWSEKKNNDKKSEQSGGGGDEIPDRESFFSMVGGFGLSGWCRGGFSVMNGSLGSCNSLRRRDMV